MDYRTRFYDRYITGHTAKLYGELTLRDIERQFPIWQSYFGALLPEDPASAILDLGCGTGALLYWFHAKGYSRAIGVDVSGEQVEAARRLGIQGVEQGDLLAFLQKHREEYDLIVMRDVIEHFSKPEILELLERVHRALKPAGRLVVQTPNAESPMSGRFRCWDFTHETSFAKGSISQAFLASGLGKVQVFPMRPVAHGPISLVRYVLWRAIELFISFYLLIETGSGSGIFTQNLIATAVKRAP